MRLFNNNIVPYASTEGDKIYPIVVDIKKGIKSGEAISFVTADNQVGVITVDFMDGNSSYSIEGCMVTSTIRRPDGTVLEIPCDIISQSTIEIPLGINGTYQEGVHTFDLKIVRGNGKVIGVPTMSYSVSGSLSSDGVVEGDDRLPVLTMVLDNAQDKLTRLDKAIAGATNDLEVKEARDGEVTLNARLERDLEKGKIHFADVEGSNISTESQEGYLENVEILGNTWQDSENLVDIRSVGNKLENQELYEIPVLSCGKNLINSDFIKGNLSQGNISTTRGHLSKPIKVTANTDIFVTVPTGYRAMVCGVAKDNIEKEALSPFYSLSHAINTKNNNYINIQIMLDDNTDIDFNSLNIEKGFQIEYGTQATPYEPYQEDKLTILSPVQLEKVGDVADRIICKDGVYGVEKNIGEEILNDKNNWISAGSNLLSYEYKVASNFNSIIGAKNILSSRFKLYETSEDADYIRGNNTVNTIHIGVSKDKDVDTVDKFKSYIKDGVLVKYKLTQPTFIPLPHSQQIKLRTFADRTNIHFETEIEPTLKAQVPKSLGATVNTHTSQIDNLNKELDRVKKLEESTVTTVTTDSSFTTIAETTQGYFEDVKLEGKTLVNLLSPNYHSVNSAWGTDEKKFILDIVTGSGQPMILGKFTQNLKRGTEYTVIINISSYTHGIPHFCFMNKENSKTTTQELTLTSSGLHKLVFTTKLDMDSYYFRIIPKYGVDNKYSIDRDILILEGDHTDKDISYFEGLKSVGQDTDEISVSSVNKNLFDVNKLQIKGNSTYGYMYLGESNEYTISITDKDISVDMSEVYFGFTGNGGEATNGVHWVMNNGKVNLTELTSYGDLKYFSFYPNDQETLNKITSRFNVQIEEGNVATSYIPHSSNKKQILYYNPTTQTWEKPILREWDSIEKHSDGKYYYHKRSEEVVFNGSESWQYSADSSRVDTNCYTLTITNCINTGNLQVGSAICDKINSGRFVDIIEKKDIEGVSCDYGKIFFCISKSKLSSQNVQGFQTWLQANPTTVVYQLAEEEVYECTNLDLITYQHETNLIVNSGAIQPKITLKVLSNVSNVVKLLQEKVSILENKFIKGLQQVLAGDMMSLAHLLYPEDFENNHEIQTLEL